MRVSRQRQIFLALCALNEIADQAQAGPIPPSFSFRFALAFLWSCSDGRSRACYDGLWRNLVDYERGPRAGAPSPYPLRLAYARDQLNGIMRSLGCDPEAMQARIDRASGKPADHPPVEKLWASITEEEKRDYARKQRECQITRIDQPFAKPKL
jgi:hypothetical protein